MELEMKLFVQFNVGDNYDLKFWNLDTIEEDMMKYFDVLLHDLFEEMEDQLSTEQVKKISTSLKDKVSGMISEYFEDYKIELHQEE